MTPPYNKAALDEAIMRPIIGCRDLTDEDMQQITTLNEAARTLSQIMPYVEEMIEASDECQTTLRADIAMKASNRYKKSFDKLKEILGGNKIG